MLNNDCERKEKVHILVFVAYYISRLNHYVRCQDHS